MQSVTLVLTGHTPGPAPRWTRANVLCIDMGAHVAEDGHLTVAEVQTADARLHRFARVDTLPEPGGENPPANHHR